MNRLLLNIILVASPTLSQADYLYMKLSSLVCQADYAATGTIVHLDESYFYLEVEEYILGNLQLDTIRIQKFINWPCGRRLHPYQVGQKELVFFQKSNYVIDEYDFLGYGGGGEFELPIIDNFILYSYEYGKSKSYLLSEFLWALKDFATLKSNTADITTLPEYEVEQFASRSTLHGTFVECPKKEALSSSRTAPSKSYITNLEKVYLYLNYTNKVGVFGFDMDSIYLYAEDAEVVKQEDHFIVIPKDGWTRRSLKVYALSDTGRSQTLYQQLFEVIELPTPQFYWGNETGDTIRSGWDAIPTVAHYLDDMTKDPHLEYELLRYDITIKSKGDITHFHIQNAHGNWALRSRLRELENKDEIIVSDILVLYPDNSVRELEDQTIIYFRNEEFE